MRQNIRKILLFLKKSFLVIGFLPFIASAAEYTLLEPLTSPSGETVTSIPNLNTYLQFVFQFAIGITGILAVIMIILGGITYLSTDAVSGKTEGKNMISNALWGLLLAILSWLILNTINPTLLNINVTP
ncbi:MAG: pilin [Patescibacteria group bacterium]